MPVLNVPFRLIFAMNPSARRRARQQPAAGEEVQVPVRGGVDVLTIGSPVHVGLAADLESGTHTERDLLHESVEGFMRALKLTIVLSAVACSPPARRWRRPPTAKPAPPAARRRPPATQTPAAPPPSAAAPAARSRAAPQPFPEGAKIAFVDVQAIASQLGRGQGRDRQARGASQEEDRRARREEQGSSQAAQTKLQQGGAVLNDSARGAAREGHREAERATSSSRSRTRSPSCRSCQDELQGEFQEKLNPVIEQVAQGEGPAHGVRASPTPARSGSNTGLDLLAEVIKRLDAARPTPRRPRSNAAQEGSSGSQVQHLNLFEPLNP